MAKHGSSSSTLRVDVEGSPCLSGSSELNRMSGSSNQRFSSYAATLYEHCEAETRDAWNRLRGEGLKHVPGWRESAKNVITNSWMNVFLLFVPLAWVSHYTNWPHELTFALCFFAIIPLENLFDWGGEQMALYLGRDLGDLLVITIDNAVETALAVALLHRCELRLLQSTVIGVIVLHLLLIPGTAFLVGGARIWEQNLHPHRTQLNLSLLAVGVLSIVLPTAFFAALDHGGQSIAANDQPAYPGTVISDDMRDRILRMSRGFAILLLLVYVGSRIFLHVTPGEDKTTTAASLAEKADEREEPELHPLACVIMLIITVGLMAATAEFLVESIQSARDAGHIQEEWFGLILLPIASFSADGCITIGLFVRSVWDHKFGTVPLVPSQVAKGRAIDLSIQFTIFWMPVLVLLGWCINRPMHLLFDYFELAVVLGSCFLVNYVTADSKTNWMEGFIMIAFYVMIVAVSAWFYTGQPELAAMLNCPGSVAAAISGDNDGVAESGGIIARAVGAVL